MFDCAWNADVIRKDIAVNDAAQLTLLTLGLEDAQGRTLVRADMTEPHFLSLGVCSKSVTVTSPNSGDVERWVLWPRFSDGSWGTRQEGCLH